LNKDPGVVDALLVFLKVSEEAQCNPRSKCEWTWTSNSIANVTAAEVVFDSTDYEWQLKLNGSDFTGDTSSVELFISNVKQTTKTVSATEAIFTIMNVTGQSLNS